MEEKEITIIEEQVSAERRMTFADLLALMWMRRKPIIIWSVIGIVLGCIIALSTPKVFKAQISMMPEMDGSSGGLSGSLGSLSAMVGLSLGSTSDAYPPDVYPDIVASIPFIIDLFDVPVQMEKSDSTMTLRHYLTKKEKEPWFKKLIRDILPKKKPKGPVKKSADEMIDPFYLNSEEYRLYDGLMHSIGTDVDLKTGMINISVSLQDPMVSAQLCDTVAARLQEYIIDYRTAKARHDLDYSIKINEEARQQYYEAQTTYAEYLRTHQGVADNSPVSTEADRLENEMQLAFNLYNATSQKVQAAQADVQEVTPVFAVVSPATVPLEPSGPNRKLMVIGFFLLFFAIGTCVAVYPRLIGNKLRKAVRREESGEGDDDDQPRRKRRKTRRMPWQRRQAEPDQGGVEEEETIEEIEETDSHNPYNLE